MVDFFCESSTVVVTMNENAEASVGGTGDSPDMTRRGFLIGSATLLSAVAAFNYENIAKTVLQPKQPVFQDVKKPQEIEGDLPKGWRYHANVLREEGVGKIVRVRVRFFRHDHVGDVNHGPRTLDACVTASNDAQGERLDISLDTKQIIDDNAFRQLKAKVCEDIKSRRPVELPEEIMGPLSDLDKQAMIGDRYQNGVHLTTKSADNIPKHQLSKSQIVGKKNGARLLSLDLGDDMADPSMAELASAIGTQVEIWQRHSGNHSSSEQEIARGLLKANTTSEADTRRMLAKAMPLIHEAMMNRIGKSEVPEKLVAGNE